MPSAPAVYIGETTTLRETGTADAGARACARGGAVPVGELRIDSPTVGPRRVRVASLLAYLVALACWVAQMGLPKQALPAFAWIWLATIAWNIRAPLRAHLDFPRDWSLPLAVLRVLQAEGYVRQPRWSRGSDGPLSLPRTLPRTHAERPGIGDAR